MIEIKAVQEVCGELGYRITVDEGGMLINDGVNSVVIDIEDCMDVIKAIVDTYQEFVEWQVRV